TVGGVQNRSYGFDAAGNITSIADNLAASRSQSFQYDALSRLTQGQGVYGTASYSYDSVGNRLSQSLVNGANTLSESYAYAPTSNRLQSVANGTATRRLGYGAAGAVTSDDHGNGTVYGYAYTGDNRLAQVTLNGAAAASYGFNFLGEQVP